MDRKKIEKEINTHINKVELGQLKLILMPLKNQNKKAFSEATSDGVESCLLNTKELSDHELEQLHKRVMDALR